MPTGVYAQLDCYRGRFAALAPPSLLEGRKDLARISGLLPSWVED